jgi:phage N-6-adenine-methyltransferase
MNPTLFSSDRGDWATPLGLFDVLDRIFNFHLDAAASRENALCTLFYDLSDDALSKPWLGSVWLNPPYGRGIGAWIEKAHTEADKGARVVCLVPARTDAKWFSRMWDADALVFIRGRLKFRDAKTSAPFPSVIGIFGRGISKAEKSELSKIGKVIEP